MKESIKMMGVPIVGRSILMMATIILLAETCDGSVVRNGKIEPPFRGPQVNWIDNRGMFLRSPNQAFAFGFRGVGNDTLFLLSVWHIRSSQVVWIANRDSPVGQNDEVVFGVDGDLLLERQGATIWSSGTARKGVSALVLQDSGNLVLSTNDSRILWQSFDYPVDTLLSGQVFNYGMELISSVETGKNFSTGIYTLKLVPGDMILIVNYTSSQQYWSLSKETRTINLQPGKIDSAKIVNNSWNLYQKNDLIMQFVFSQNPTPNITWAAVLRNDATISFLNLQNDNVDPSVQWKIPQFECDTPQACPPYYICSDNPKTCVCPEVLNSGSLCQPAVSPSCSSKDSFKLVNIGREGVGYFANRFSSPVVSNTNLAGCQDSCLRNCSCAALFFDNKSGSCFQYSQLGTLKGDENSYSAYVKIPNNGLGGPSSGNRKTSSRRTLIIVLVIAIFTVSVIGVMVYLAFKLHKKTEVAEPILDSTDDDADFLEGLSGSPVRYTYKELQTATNNFSVKLGQGGFGSVYRGVLPDGGLIAVKKLESIGQGKKEFRAEVNIIGSIHHVHLVRLRGFCAEGTHRLLAYEFMAKGSLDKWIFSDEKEGFMLDWDKRYNIAIATAKGLAYLHEDCNMKVVHCDIKPENVLLDNNFVAKVSDFGLAKLMTREQSLVCTTLRGTRGYLAPEWITNYAISEKSDVYSFGIVLLEIVGGRKNFDTEVTTEKAHFPSYAFKKMEEGKLKDVLDARLHYNDKDERVLIAIRVALWCIQEDMTLRPSMSKVVQMLEGLIEVPSPPTSMAFGFRIYSNILKSTSGEASSSNPSDSNSKAFLSAVRLSGPR